MSIFDRVTFVQSAAPSEGPWNMAEDEWWFCNACQPWVRVYSWAKPSVSFGYFQKQEEARIYAGEHPMVRRWTGGGLVRHGEDLCYTVGVPGRIAAGFGRQLYGEIHSAFQQLMQSLGMDCELVDCDARFDAGGACFQHPVAWDLMLEGHKIAGAAQRRTRAGLMHQGSIQCPGLWRNEEVDFMRKTCAILAETIQSEALPDSAIEEVAELAAAKYGSQIWTNRV